MPKEKSSKKSTGDGRTRNFTALLYPDSENTPDDWYDKLCDWKIPMFISPLHDKDENLTGEPKKAHYHLILCFDSVKTVEQAMEVFNSVGAVPPPGDRIKVQSIRGAVRYLCHLDNPEKYQYDSAEVKTLFGADFASTISLVTDKYKAIAEMIDFCKENNIVSFSDLLEYSMISRYEWFRVLCDNGAVIMEKYLKSRSWTFERQQKDSVYIKRVVDCEVDKRLNDLE